MTGYIFALTSGTGEIKYIFYEIAAAITKARALHLIVIRYRVSDDGSVRKMIIFDPLNNFFQDQNGQDQ